MRWCQARFLSPKALGFGWFGDMISPNHPKPKVFSCLLEKMCNFGLLDGFGCFENVIYYIRIWSFLACSKSCSQHAAAQFASHLMDHTEDVDKLFGGGHPEELLQLKKTAENTAVSGDLLLKKVY